jgi:hypothetical protein
MIFIFYILTLIYPCADGIDDSVKWSRKGADAFKWDEHRPKIVQRFLVCLYIVLAIWFRLTILDAIVLDICWVLAYPFWHNGFYYSYRKKIDGSYHGFFDDSTTSTAYINVLAPLRIAMFILSLISFITY